MVAGNAFVSLINPAPSNIRLFCGEMETLFHGFSECARLGTLFALLAKVCTCFGKTFSVVKCIFGAGYRKASQTKW